MLENLELTIVQEYIDDRIGKRKRAKPILHRDEIGSVKIDFCFDAEALEKLITVIQEEVFKHDGVKIEISAISSNF